MVAKKARSAPILISEAIRCRNGNGLPASAIVVIDGPALGRKSCSISFKKRVFFRHMALGNTFLDFISATIYAHTN
jgi:hypothetical protein